MTLFQNCPSEPGFIRRLVVGAALVRLAAESRFGRQNGDFWEVLSWWWEETHVLIPEQLEEQRVSSELEQTFRFGEDQTAGITDHGPVFTITSSGSLGLGTVSPTSRLSIRAQTGTPTGAWEWEGIRVETETAPHPTRRLLISVLSGAKWKPHESPSPTETKKSSITPYGRLSQRWD